MKRVAVLSIGSLLSFACAARQASMASPQCFLSKGEKGLIPPLFWSHGGGISMSRRTSPALSGTVSYGSRAYSIA